MSWRDRPYSGDEGPELRLAFRKPSTAVTWLIIANVAVFVVELISLNWSGMPAFVRIFGLSLNGIREFYFWQPLTYMFLHSPDSVFHLLMNMLGLYIFGSEFERTFGRQRFLQFYGICGVVGGMAYLVLSLLSPEHQNMPLVGASGAVFGLLVAAVIFFPHIQVVLLIFPMPVRVFALIWAGILLLQILSGSVQNVGGEVCHLAGAATGIVLFYAWGTMPRIRVGSGRLSSRLQEGAWARRQREAAEEQAEVDRILAKIHSEGLNSLTRKERKTLAEATRHQREREQEFGRLDRL
ncbi:MAG TPA: rhomboid family intramembrane serine protease [Phycisphaerae bacterium]|jgi:membrane associated rhomboid family serine protease|nr:rhomboid family intramembrane serine protease [Phycisphaerae bacterium]HOB73641.1 rhomboid family intramembrane serine protease [Phycisphaerae bacterium]HOJ54754.1 rhomboid family intramembrane serine protease [Phycisphaerae bacterium]HOL25894.1 rhomboid family intramembrane serine protease [Phycisphaerae bacterium]HPP21174.1 rhomboid family intramembrane serine protease [Phycisphaerae bacterium]